MYEATMGGAQQGRLPTLVDVASALGSINEKTRQLEVVLTRLESHLTGPRITNGQVDGNAKTPTISALHSMTSVAQESDRRLSGCAMIAERIEQALGANDNAREREAVDPLAGAQLRPPSARPNSF